MQWLYNLSLFHHPNLYYTIIASERQALTIMRPGHSTDGSGMAIAIYFASICRIPNLYTTIRTCRSQTASIWRPIYSSHRTCMTASAKDIISCDHIPDLHYLIITTRGDN